MAEQEQQEQETFYSDHQTNQAIIMPHSKFIQKKYFQNEKGQLIELDDKIEIINPDLTSGFSSSEMQLFAFGTADYLSKILKFEKKYGVDLTQEYNQEARKINFTYALSKSGGMAANIAKQHKVITESYGVSEQRQIQGKKSFFSAPDWLKKGEKGLDY